MKKIHFIKKLIEEEKISLVEPSLEISTSYGKKSENSLKAAKILIEQKLIEESISMSYYAMFHKTNALFQRTGIKIENHAATIILLQELFKIENKDLTFAKEERIDKQYYTDVKVTEEDARNLILMAETFIEKLDLFTDKLTEGNIKKYKEEFEKTYF